MVAAPRIETPLIQLPLFDFEGPLELLLDLVERRRLPIAELSLAAVADQYLGHVRALGASQDALSEFVVIGARLVLIKSRTLLGDSAASPDEEDGAEDLVRRLQVYRAFRDAAETLRHLEASGRAAFTRGALGERQLNSDPPLAPIPPRLLAWLLREIEARAGPEPVAHPSLARRVSIAERLAFLRERLRARREVSWQEVAGTDVPEMVATFLALLELVRRGEVQVEQRALFGPIRVRLLDEPAVAGGRAAAVGQAKLA